MPRHSQSTILRLCNTIIDFHHFYIRINLLYRFIANLLKACIRCILLSRRSLFQIRRDSYSWSLVGTSLAVSIKSCILIVTQLCLIQIWPMLCNLRGSKILKGGLLATRCYFLLIHNHHVSLRSISNRHSVILHVQHISIRPYLLMSCVPLILASEHRLILFKSFYFGVPVKLTKLSIKIIWKLTSQS